MSLGAELKRLADKLDSKSGGRLSQTSAARAWLGMCGETVASHTTGFFLRNGEAVVYVDSNIWATELSALSGTYMVRINEALGQEVVTSMRFVVSRKVSEDRAFEAEDRIVRKGSGPERIPTVALSEIEMAQLRAAAGRVKDEDLREAAVRATKADLEWKKGQNAHLNRDKPADGL